MIAGIQAAVFAQADTPRLVLQITVDQLRGDFITRYEKRLGAGGFRYLLDNGVYYTNAHYQHANTETIVGHASLATGTVPAAHGMVGNIWFDRELGRQVYNIEDPDYHLLSADADVDSSTEIDPTQRAAKADGRSPNAILSSTFGDELSLHFGGKSKVFGVSVKDRGAVAMAGHAGKAFWFSKAGGAFVTSSYYYDRYPEWVMKSPRNWSTVICSTRRGVSACAKTAAWIAAIMVKVAARRIGVLIGVLLGVLSGCLRVRRQQRVGAVHPVRYWRKHRWHWPRN